MVTSSAWPQVCWEGPGELQLGLVSAGHPISKELDCFGRPCSLAAPAGRHRPRADLAKDALSMGLVAHVIEVIQRNAEVPHVRNIHVGKQRPDVLSEANCHRPTPLSVSSDTGSHFLDRSTAAEVLRAREALRARDSCPGVVTARPWPRTRSGNYRTRRGQAGQPVTTLADARRGRTSSGDR